MKHNKPRKKTKRSPYRQGYFEPKNKSKYFGTFPIIYRSSYELKFCHFCDNSPQVIKWASEPDFSPFPIEYIDTDGVRRRYYPDFLMYVKTDKGVRQYVIEVKPNSHLKRPKKPKKKKRQHASTYLTEVKKYEKRKRFFELNRIKMEYAKQFCKKRGMIYKLITEDWLFNKTKRKK